VENGSNGILASIGIRLHDKAKTRDETIAKAAEKMFTNHRSLR
jgi:hypothetical protein